MPQGGHNAKGDTDHHPQHPGDQVELHRDREEGTNEAAHRLPPVFDDGLPKIAVQGPPDVTGILDGERSIQTPRLSKACYDSRVGVLPQEYLHRVTRSVVSQGKGDKGHNQQQNRQPQKAPDDVSNHFRFNPFRWTRTAAWQ